LDSYTAASTSSLTAGDAKLADTTLGAYYAFDKSTSAYFVGSLVGVFGWSAGLHGPICFLAQLIYLIVQMQPKRPLILGLTG
jgi:hypothetical protein